MHLANLVPTPAPNPKPVPLTQLTDAHLDALARGLSRRAEVVIERRWEEWLPLVALWAAKKRIPADDLRRYQRKARNAALIALSRGLGWPTIRAGRLDDPRDDDADLLKRIDAAAARRKSYARPQRKRRVERPKEPHANE